MEGAERMLPEKTEVIREMVRELKECTITRAQRKEHFKKRM